MQTTGSKKDSTLNFCCKAGYNSGDKTGGEIMKKQVSLLLVIMICLILNACGESKNNLNSEQEESGGDAGQMVSITKENYQQLFALAPEYQYIGIAYYKAPEGRFASDQFTDAYIPYGDKISYPNDGYAVEVEAHGMRVFHTNVRTDGNAQDVVDQAYQKMIDDGMNVSQDYSKETYYDKDYDIATKQIAFFEDNGTKPRIAILYADTRGNGYYVSAQITYLPEQYDDAHDALLEELRDVFAVKLPDIPAL